MSPAWAASIAAFIARRLVCDAMVAMTVLASSSDVERSTID